jgi:hypothetical protein
MMNAYYVEQELDVPRPPANRRPTLYIGPPRQLGGPLLEVMAEDGAIVEITTFGPELFAAFGLGPTL